MTRLLATSLLMLAFLLPAWGKNIEYFIKIVEGAWNYCPTNMNIISGKPISEDESASIYCLNGPDRIGPVYKKAMYKQYTNASYTEEVAKPPWLGFLGPILKGEVGDSLVIHMKNKASRIYSMHPHKVKYTKLNEGALYPDNRPGSDKLDDMVAPGESYTYTWDLVEAHGPGEGDLDCVTSMYHSHIDAPRDISSGAIGPMVVCKPGALLKQEEQPTNVDFSMLFSIFDENMSYYLDENIKTYCTAEVDKEDPDFQESNQMHSVNGFMYGNLPGLSMDCGKTVTWHLFGIGNEDGIHSPYFHGNLFQKNHHRADTISLFPATLREVVMQPTNPGKWLLSCQVNDHIAGGMAVIYEVKKSPACAEDMKSGRPVKHYYIAAEESVWNYAPSGIDQFTGKPLDDPESESFVFFEKSGNRIGGSYKKALFKEYTDCTFKKRKERTPEEKHLGLLGPAISAETGDVIMVTFYNKASHPFSMQAHGVRYSKSNEGALYYTDVLPEGVPPSPPPASYVKPGQNFTYVWSIPDDAGPTPEDPPCLTWPYFSSVDPIKDTNAGLVGPLIVCRKGTLKDARTKRMFMLATVFDENMSHYLDDNIQMFITSPNTADKTNADFIESNEMHSMNGYMYGNQPGLDMCKGDTVSWHMIGMGTEIDMHGISFSGNTFSTSGTNRNTASLFPHVSYTVTMVPDNEGVFSVVCLTTDHFMGGMKQHYTVKNCHQAADEKPYLQVSTVYIGAVEEDWDYSPSREWEKERYGGLENSPGNTFLDKGEKFVGSIYKKAFYREFTDASFTTRKPRTAQEEHLSILGPLLRATVGDTMRIVFKNCASRPYSIHAQGVKTDSSTVKETQPGQTQTYTWNIPERSGPGEGDGDWITWPYFSMVNQVKDTYSGLVGALIVSQNHKLTYYKIFEKMHFVLLFFIFNENESWYLKNNIDTFSAHPDQVNVTDEDFQESNKMHAINGRVYGNLKGLNMQAGDETVWHLFALGNEVDIHTAHFHGNSFNFKNTGVHHADVYNLFPGAYETVEMLALYNGTWLLHCHVNDHIIAGMETTYTVA